MRHKESRILFPVALAVFLLAGCPKPLPPPEPIVDPCAECQGQLRTARNRSRDLERQLSDVQGQLRTARNRSRDLERQLQTARARSGALERQLSDAQEQLHQFQGAYNSCQEELQTDHLGWGVPTRYAIQNLDRQVQEALSARLSQDGFGFEEANREDEQYAFTLPNIEDMEQLKKVQSIIRDVSQEQAVPVDLTRATLVFDSVGGDVGSSIRITGEATPGARVWIDVGMESRIEAPVNERGVWQVDVPETAGEALNRQNGRAYVLIEMGGARRYLEITVLSQKRRNVREEDLPNAVRQRLRPPQTQ